MAAKGAKGKRKRGSVEKEEESSGLLETFVFIVGSIMTAFFMAWWWMYLQFAYFGLLDLLLLPVIASMVFTVAGIRLRKKVNSVFWFRIAVIALIADAAVFITAAMCF